MKINPNICLVDEDSTLKDSWKLALDAEVELSFFSDPVKLLEQCAASPKGFLSQYACIVLGRKFQGGRIDICKDEFQSLRDVLMKGARETSIWVRESFMKAPDVHVSSPEFFEQAMLYYQRHCV